jgi:hypothetical protein
MATCKRIVCLANSRKLQGRCVAGYEVVHGTPTGWVRPVSDRPHEEVSEYERQYEDGSDPRVLDLVDVPLQEPRPRGYQQENWLLDPERYWIRVGHVRWDALARLAERGGDLWLNGYRTFHGENDKIPLESAARIRSSLKLIHVDGLALKVFKPSETFGNPKRKVQARFRFAGNGYALSVTDPIIERAYLAQEDGKHDLGESYLTISLGEAFNDCCYKLVAAVIQRA